MRLVSDIQHTSRHMHILEFSLCLSWYAYYSTAVLLQVDRVTLLSAPAQAGGGASLSTMQRIRLSTSGATRPSDHNVVLAEAA